MKKIEQTRKYMQKWKIQIELEVSDTWVEDGFDASHPNRIEEIQEAFANMLPYAYDDEVKTTVKILSAPDKKKIRQLQGY